MAELCGNQDLTRICAGLWDTWAKNRQRRSFWKVCGGWNIEAMTLLGFACWMEAGFRSENVSGAYRAWKSW